MSWARKYVDTTPAKGSSKDFKIRRRLSG